jgi:hypothetical protein
MCKLQTEDTTGERAGDKYKPWVRRNSSPCIVDGAFEDLTAVCHNIFNDVHVKPYTFCLCAHNSSWTESLCY